MGAIELDIRFYHLTTSSLENSLPKLLGLTLSRGHRALVRFGSQERMAWFNDFLWTFNDRQFVPHGVSDDVFAADQPVLLTTQSQGSANKAEFVFWVDGFMPNGADNVFETTEGASRLSIMFASQDQAQLASARSLFKQAKSLGGEPPSYWKQDDQGRWHQAA